MSSIPSPSQRAWDAFLLSRFGAADQTSCGAAGFEARAALLDLELEILQDPRTLASARRLRNSSNPAYSLASEVLTHVLWFSQANWAPRQDWEACNGDIGWIALCHVCSRWREVALSTPSLWCDLGCYGLAIRAIPTILARSRQNKLRLFFLGIDHVDGSDSDDIPTIWMSPPICQRTSELVVAESMVRFLEIWIPLLRTSMPTLTRLVVNVKMAPRTSEEIVLPSEMLGSAHLSVVDLLDCHLPWQSQLFNAASLTRLRLQSINPPDPSRLPSFLQLCDVLNRAPALEDLTLSNIFPTFSDQRVTVDATAVRLPSSLTDLALSASPAAVRDCLNTLLSLALPIKTRARFFAALGTGAEPSLMARIISHFFSSPPDEPLELHIRSRYLVLSWSKSWLAGDSECGIEWPKSKFCKGERRLSIAGEDGEEDTEHEDGSGSSFMSHLTLLPMDQLHRLAITSDAMRALSNPDAWRTAFQKAVNVHNLALHFTRESIPLLCVLAETSGNGSTHKIQLLPNLTVIALFRDVAEDDAEVCMSDSDSVRLQISLANLLHTRARVGTPLEALRVQPGLLEEDTLHSLMELANITNF
ncbi:hypothetical protein PENSPDRAFT_758249 [Peniophora sp. CONT]|nr:hypothetical protein PENSPDRAFT_758249 [Peniophora sp. CONT]